MFNIKIIIKNKDFSIDIVVDLELIKAIWTSPLKVLRRFFSKLKGNTAQFTEEGSAVKQSDPFSHIPDPDVTSCSMTLEGGEGESNDDPSPTPPDATVFNNSVHDLTVKAYALLDDCQGTEVVIGSTLIPSMENWNFDATTVSKDIVSRFEILSSTSGTGPGGLIEIGGCIPRSSDDGQIGVNDISMFVINDDYREIFIDETTP